MKNDRRQMRTKQLIREALLDLIPEKGLAKITVKDLTERADINRGTFYLHYKDVEDLTDQLKEEIFAELPLLTSRIDPTDIKIAAKQNEPYEPIQALLTYLLSHSDFLRVMLLPEGDLHLAMQLKDFMKENMLKKFEQYLGPENDSPAVPADYFMAYITSANIGLLTHWMTSGNDLPVEDIALMMTKIMSQGPLEAMMGGDVDRREHWEKEE
ncbi:TetR/AcrR family transcriptional regulator [Rossellomorea marisflavi]|uniref:TetR/AcrR family transcriptional regulator n=1 Tax=Rossellomorea marisflavi TaxID=189381 RepID=UPI00207A65F7|nr:TetR/AcrR family transcriptional regulator [Rossellomorea marisflavi]USK91478.1 TetR/AcrR family transcriptional regulator [Rossellomorea marisflavi]